MKTLLLAIAVVKQNDYILLRRMDPAKNPYQEPWALFGGRIEGGLSVLNSLNKELDERWNFTVSIIEKLYWNDEVKTDHDGEEKHFVYLDVLCGIADGKPRPTNENETLEWVALSDLVNYELNPPTKTVLEQLGYLT